MNPAIGLAIVIGVGYLVILPLVVLSKGRGLSTGALVASSGIMAAIAAVVVGVERDAPVIAIVAVAILCAVTAIAGAFAFGSRSSNDDTAR